MHGTICAAIIIKYLPDAEITSIKVLDEKTGRGVLQQLLVALEWCLDNHIPFINLSIGSIQFKDFKGIRRLVSALYRQGCIVVAAYNNQNIYTIPASLECVIGVRHNPSLNLQEYVVNMKEYEYYVESNMRHHFMDIHGHEVEAAASNSFATPYITAMVCQGQENRGGVYLHEIWEHLSGENITRFCSIPDTIDEAVVMDFIGTERHDLFYFKLRKVYTREDMHRLRKTQEFIYLVILAESEDDLLPLTDIVNTIEPFIRGVFCCFKKGVDNFNGSMKGRAWYETYYTEKFTRPVVIDVDIPIVYLQGIKETLIIILAEVEDMLIEADYAVKVIGEFARAYLYGFEYCDSVESRMNTIMNVLKHYYLDIIIYGIETVLSVSDGEGLLITLDEHPYIDGCAELIYQKIIETFDDA
jgi:hypothetical protein